MIFDSGKAIRFEPGQTIVRRSVRPDPAWEPSRFGPAWDLPQPALTSWR